MFLRQKVIAHLLHAHALPVHEQTCGMTVTIIRTKPFTSVFVFILTVLKILIRHPIRVAIDVDGQIATIYSYHCFSKELN
jgi:hypothetical protein